MRRMGGAGTLVIQTARKGEGPTSSELVMAWARDSATGEPRWILELGQEQRGAKCGCECPSCGLALTAVNAAKDEFIRRPHFRHPEGAVRDACVVLAARVAAMGQLQDGGWIALPRRRLSARVTGLSGHYYDAWVERRSERLHIRHVDYRDRTAAVFTFDDGRQLRVVLTGIAGKHDEVLDWRGLPMPTVVVDVDDPRLAAMPPDELRRRLKLLPDGLCWRHHWNDADLFAEALAKANAEAHCFLDDEPTDIEFPAGLDPSLRRETVLHYEVKRILVEERRLTVPGMEVVEDVSTVGGTLLHGQWAVDAMTLDLDLIVLEQRFGRLIPDITCRAWSSEGGDVFGPLLVEVTVTNQIDDERLARIQSAGEAALEIDLSRTGGRVTRDELRRLVVDELAFKRWLHHPTAVRESARIHAALAEQASAEIADAQVRAQAIAERHKRVLDTPVGDVALEYLDAVFALVEAGAAEQLDGKLSAESTAGELVARERVAEAADKMAIHGYPEAADENLIGYHGILTRILSISLGRPIGYRVENVMGVLNAICQLTWPSSSTVTLYLIAVRAYGPHLDATHWFEQWASRIKASLKRGENTYRRDPAYDRLLTLLFPVMAPGLAKEGAIAKPQQAVRSGHATRTDGLDDLPRRRRAGFLEDQPSAHEASGRLLDTRPGDWWLKGRDLKAWEEANPESARAWFNARLEPSSDQ